MRTIQRAVVFAIALALALPCLAQEAQAGDPFQAQLKLCEAISSGDVKAAAGALDAGAKLAQVCPKEMIPPLHQAVEVGKVDMVTLLLEQKAEGCLRWLH